MIKLNVSMGKIVSTLFLIMFLWLDSVHLFDSEVVELHNESQPQTTWIAPASKQNSMTLKAIQNKTRIADSHSIGNLNPKHCSDTQHGKSHSCHFGHCHYLTTDSRALQVYEFESKWQNSNSFLMPTISLPALIEPPSVS